MRDESIFQGIKELDTPHGKLQFHLMKDHPCLVYVLEDRAWVHRATFPTTNLTMRPGQLYKQFLIAIGEDDEEENP